MSCANDPVPLTDEIVAERTARLAKVAEETCMAHFGESDLVYVIGTEVPVQWRSRNVNRHGGNNARCRTRNASGSLSRL